jgi:hypothetical protein
MCLNVNQIQTQAEVRGLNYLEKKVIVLLMAHYLIPKKVYEKNQYSTNIVDNNNICD